MKAIVVSRYGPPEVLQLTEVEKPVPRDREVLIKIRASAINSTDPVFRKGKPFMSRFFSGLFRPKFSIPGDVLAGEIEEVGKDVRAFNKGDQVFGYTPEDFGAHAQYKCLREDGALAIKPQEMSYEEAAGLVDGALTALHFLRDKAKVQEGQKVLVYGASGSVGTAAVQLAFYFGAEVTGVCSTVNLEMVRALGANTVIDYTKEDFTQKGEIYDVVFDTVAKRSFSQCKNALTPNGVYLTTFPTLASMVQAFLMPTKKKGKRATFAAAGLRPSKEKARDLNFLSELVREGKMKTILDRRYSLAEIPEAHRYVEEGHKKGNVVISIQ